MIKRKSVQKRVVISLFSAILLFAIALALFFRTGITSFREPPLEPGQLFRFQNGAIMSITLKDSASNTRKLTEKEDLLKALSCLEEFRYQSVVYEEPVGGKQEYSFFLQSASEKASPAVSTVFNFRENAVRLDNYWYISETSSLRDLLELCQ